MFTIQSCIAQRRSEVTGWKTSGIIIIGHYSGTPCITKVLFQLPIRFCTQWGSGFIICKGMFTTMYIVDPFDQGLSEVGGCVPMAY